MKKCGKCSVVKEKSEFSKRSRAIDGLQSYCKQCNRRYLKVFNVDYLPKRRSGDQTLTGSYLHSIWNKMKRRCSDPSDTHYMDYGGRGIKVCDRWLNWELFLEDMHDSYEMGLSIERVDVNKVYYPDNCLWIPRLEQAFNKRNSVRVKINGEDIAVAKRSREIGLDPSVVISRIKRGDEGEDLFRPAAPLNRMSSEAKKFIAEIFNEDVRLAYIRQLKSDWKVGRPSSALAAIVGPYQP